MSSAILGGDVTVYYLDETRQKRIHWTGGATTRTLNELYSALQDLFDEPNQMDDGNPMSAETPVEYTTGIIDAGDLDPWYVSYELMEHITGGALRTNGWTRATGTNTGIIVVAVTSNNIVPGDVGNTISGATTGAGTLLEVIEAGTTDYLVIRPDSSAAGDDFTTDTQTITCNAHTASQSGSASFTGEQIWANLYSIGNIQPDTHIYIYQGSAADDADRIRIKSIVDSTQDWWGDGHIDVLLYTKDFKQAGNPTIDGGYATVLARKATNLYSAFEVATSLTSGGRNPIPLQTEPDLNNTTGYKSITFTAASGNWSVGDEISGDSSTARAIITKIDNPGSTQTVHYYLIDDPLTDFSSGAEGITNEDDTGTGTKDANPSADQGPALTGWFSGSGAPTVAFGFATFDVDDDGTAEWYGLTIDCNQNPLDEVYEWLKYVLQRGQTGTTNSDGIPGELYRGCEAYLKYSGTVTGTIAEGSNVTQETSGATGVVVSHDTTNKVILLRSIRGTFATGASDHTLTDGDTGGTVEIDSDAAVFAPKDASPFGTFAGGVFFGARGVLLSDWASADENNFQLTDAAGGNYSRPLAISISVTNLTQNGDETVDTADRVAVFRLSAGAIQKDEYSATGGEAIGATSLVVDSAITQDTPGKATGGVVRIRKAADGANYRVRFASWATSTFTLANYSATAEAGTDTDTIVDVGAFATAKRGDILVNTSRSNAVSYITKVTSDDSVEIDPPITGQTTGDSISFNVIPVAIVAGDDVYVPLIDRFASASTESVSIIYVSPISFRVNVRNSAATTKIKPFTADGSTSGTDQSVPVVRTTDTIVQ